MELMFYLTTEERTCVGSIWYSEQSDRTMFDLFLQEARLERLPLVDLLREIEVKNFLRVIWKDPPNVICKRVNSCGDIIASFLWDGETNEKVGLPDFWDKDKVLEVIW
ncbi:MAG: hypothetical protein PHY93_20940 [Bacteriovorax sp.]|nr:hypothetical protein [Bacteriovorax sp.]